MVKNSDSSLPKEKPTIRLDENDFPDIKDLKVDDECTVTVRVKLLSTGRDQWGDDKRIWGTFRVLDVRSDGTNAFVKGMDSVKGGPRTKGS